MLQSQSNRLGTRSRITDMEEGLPQVRTPFVILPIILIIFFKYVKIPCPFYSVLERDARDPSLLPWMEMSDQSHQNHVQ